MSTMKAKAARKNYQEVKKTSKPGSGKRFAALKKSIAAEGNAKDAGAIAAAIGRKKYGNAKFQKMAKAGKTK